MKKILMLLIIIAVLMGIAEILVGRKSTYAGRSAPTWISYNYGLQTKATQFKIGDRIQLLGSGYKISSPYVIRFSNGVVAPFSVSRISEPNGQMYLWVNCVGYQCLPGNSVTLSAGSWISTVFENNVKMATERFRIEEN